MTSNIWLIPVIAAVIIARRFSRIAGGIVGVLAAIGVGVWGWLAFSEGGGMAFVGRPVPQPVFLGAIGLWLAIEAWGLYSALQRRNAKTDQ